MPNLMYEGQVRVDDKKADGSRLIIGKGDRQGEPYYKVSFKVDDQWVNLMDFDGVTKGTPGSYRVEYYQKFAPNGEPDLYNGKPQFQMVDITPLETQASAPMPAKAPYNESLGAYQTSLNCAVTYYAAGIQAGLLTMMPDLNVITAAATFFHSFLTTGAIPPADFTDEVLRATEGLGTTVDEDIPFLEGPPA